MNEQYVYERRLAKSTKRKNKDGSFQNVVIYTDFESRLIKDFTTFIYVLVQTNKVPNVDSDKRSDIINGLKKYNLTVAIKDFISNEDYEDKYYTQFKTKTADETSIYGLLKSKWTGIKQAIRRRGTMTAWSKEQVLAKAKNKIASKQHGSGSTKKRKREKDSIKQKIIDLLNDDDDREEELKKLLNGKNVDVFEDEHNVDDFEDEHNGRSQPLTEMTEKEKRLTRIQSDITNLGMGIRKNDCICIEYKASGRLNSNMARLRRHSRNCDNTKRYSNWKELTDNIKYSRTNVSIDQSIGFKTKYYIKTGNMYFYFIGVDPEVDDVNDDNDDNDDDDDDDSAIEKIKKFVKDHENITDNFVQVCDGLQAILKHILL